MSAWNEKYICEDKIPGKYLILKSNSYPISIQVSVIIQMMTELQVSDSSDRAQKTFLCE